MSHVALDEKIPNNVDLSTDRKLQRALERWQPKFLDWWKEMGPEGFQAAQIYLRTAVSVDSAGWASFDFVKMPDYRWGIFLADRVAERTIGFGDDYGKPVWQEVPGEHRMTLRRLITTQGDTEPASVEQQRRLGQSCPSLYDLRNLFQVNVEEARHLWAMVYLLHGYFGSEGRDEAEELLRRRSGDPDTPRILDAFNAPIDDWLDFFMFATFTDRDGKFQLQALAESAFDPLSRTCRFMLTEEAHHLFVGELGVGRIVRRTAELMREGKDPRREGAIDLATLQRYLNYWFSASLDLFGGEVSTNAASFFAAGLKGRPQESERYDDHVALDATREVEICEDGRVVRKEVPSRLAMNEFLREGFARDCERALARWNRHLGELGTTLRLPSVRFHRRQGAFRDGFFDAEGREVTEGAFDAKRAELLPTDDDKRYVRSLMARPVARTGQFASWIAPPDKGIDGRPVEFEYVRFNEE